jgi:hypothetical protein
VIVKKLYAAKYEIISVGDAATQLATIASGSADCANSAALFGNLTESGQIHVVVDSRDKAALPKGWPNNAVEASLWGVKANLQQKSEAVSRFLKGYHQSVTTTFRTSTPEFLAEMGRRAPENQAFKLEDISKPLEILRPFFSPGAGFIDKDDWTITRQWLFEGGITYLSDTDPKWSYEARVDMSYYLKGIGQPKR